MSDFKPTAEQINEYVALTGTSEIKIHSDGMFTLTTPLTRAAANKLAKSTANNDLGVSFEKLEGYTDKYIATFSAPNLAKKEQGTYLYDKNIEYNGSITSALDTNAVQRSYKDNIDVANFLSTMGDNGMTFTKDANGQLISDQTLTARQAGILNEYLDTSWSLGSGNITTDSRDRLVIKDPSSLGNLAWENAEKAFEEMRVTGTKGSLEKDAWEYKKVKVAKEIKSLPVKNTDAPLEKAEIAVTPAAATSTAAAPVADATDTAPATATPAGKLVDTKLENPVEAERKNEATPTTAAAPTLPTTAPASVPNTDAASPTPPNAAAAPPATPAPTAAANPTTTAAPTPAPEEKKPAPAAPAPASAAETKPEDKDTKGDGKSTGGEQKPTTPPDPKKPADRDFGEMISDTFSNNQGIMFGLIGGLAGLLLTGGGGIASFLIAGVIALIAAFVGPKIMESMTQSSEKPTHGLSVEQLKQLDNVGQDKQKALDNTVDLKALAALATKGKSGDKLGKDDLIEGLKFNEADAEKVMQYVKTQTKLEADKDGNIDVNTIPNLNLALPKIAVDSKATGK